MVGWVGEWIYRHIEEARLTSYDGGDDIATLPALFLSDAGFWRLGLG